MREVRYAEDTEIYVMSILKLIRAVYIICLLLFTSGQVVASEEGMASYHYGLFHPSGIDIFGYSVEEKISENTYKYYSFGIPSFAAIGVNYYENYTGNGITTSAGVGLGTLFNVSVAYQFHTSADNYFKLGAGFTSNIAYNGFFSVLSYEQRFKK